MPFPNIGAPELIVILIIALIVLGPGKLPDVAASLGKSVREFRKAATDISDAAKLDAPAPAPTVAATTVAPTATVAPVAPVVAPSTTEPTPNSLSGASEPNTLKTEDPKLS
ncbi:MAG TPA: twin-arginine translocase TatA/TatE family subunit [Candidatus Dormibacteraeota bacterium]|nr:twin-arginine translocase TatA/TatE family subunit [Candidatus Dormibacteraeota bacterium]